MDPEEGPRASCCIFQKQVVVKEMDNFNNHVNQILPDKVGCDTHQTCMVCEKSLCCSETCMNSPGVLDCNCKPVLCRGCLLVHILITGSYSDGTHRFKCPTCRMRFSISSDFVFLLA